MEACLSDLAVPSLRYKRFMFPCNRKVYCVTDKQLLKSLFSGKMNMLHVAFHCIYTFLEPNSHTQTSVQNLTQNTFLYSKLLMTLSHTVFIVITHYYFPLVQPLAEEKGKQSMHFFWHDSLPPKPQGLSWFLPLR